MRAAMLAGCALAAMVAVTTAQDEKQIYHPKQGVVAPKIVKETKPRYTSEAIRAKIQGNVRMAAVVERNGSVGDVEVLKSLDTEYGLDAEAVKALKQWQFAPGTRDGKPVRVRVEVEMTFTLRNDRRDPQPLK